MKDQRASYSAKHKRSSVQIRVLDMNRHTSEKKLDPYHTPSTSGSYDRLSDEMQVEVEFFKIPYWLNYPAFYYI